MPHSMRQANLNTESEGLSTASGGEGIAKGAWPFRPLTALRGAVPAISEVKIKQSPHC